MRLKHFEYIKLVTEAYKTKRANNELSPLLAQSTRSRIRKECLAVYRERYDRKDEQTLRAFFGVPDTVKQFLPLIERHETDKFKPLDNYLKGKTDSTDHTNLELLAWLIDFPHRPYVYDKELELPAEEKDVTNSPVAIGEIPVTDVLQASPLEQEEVGKGEEKEAPIELKSHASPEPSIIPGSHTGNRKYKWAGLVILMLVIGSGGAYMVGDMKSDCMYWAGDHYEKAACDDQSNGRLLLPLNEKKIKHFRRINREDTITAQSIGKLFYIKDSNRIEYYTEGGSYPENLNRTLKKLSRYIFEKDSVNRKSANN
jgi:hypothetical protein